ncbi:hypothetical protein D049_1292A, partial [Vibrio parahaemolyticus VPTS-2010]
MNVIKLVT